MKYSFCLLEVVKGVVRPVVTFADWTLLIVLCIMGIKHNIPVSKWIPEPISYLSYMINLFWFSDRMLQNGVTSFITAKKNGSTAVVDSKQPQQ